MLFLMYTSKAESNLTLAILVWSHSIWPSIDLGWSLETLISSVPHMSVNDRPLACLSPFPLL